MKITKIITALLAVIIILSAMNYSVYASNAAASVSSAGNTENIDNQKQLSDDLPAYLARAYEFVNNGHPVFTENELNTIKNTTYSKLDSFNRCGVCVAYLGPDTLQKTDRKDKDTKNPVGWNSVLFEGSKDEYMYVRTRLIGWKLDGAKEDIQNLMTGTEQFALEGMTEIETIVAGYIETSGNHVLYRVTPVYQGNNLLADGALIEAESVEDKGAGLQICVYCYNLQPSIEIDYATGKVLSTKIEKLSPLEALAGTTAAIAGTKSAASVTSKEESVTEKPSASENTAEPSNVVTYVGNKNTKKFHKPNCKSVDQMKEKNKVFFYGDRSEPIGKGYDPCGNCHP